MKYILQLLLIILIFSGCASKRFANKALKYENTGLYTDAANLYYRSLTANINNIDAKIGLQRTGQLVLDDYINKFKSEYQNGTPKNAVYAFIKADKYNKQLQQVGVNLIFPEEQKVYYQEVEDTYLSDLYREASKALDLEMFDNAEKLFFEIETINKSYKDAHSKWVIAKYEPIYRHGLEQMNSQMYRSAYNTFAIIAKDIQSYKNSVELQLESLNNAKVTIIIAPVGYYNSLSKTFAGQLEGKISNGITNIKSPFYEVVSISSLDQPTIANGSTLFDMLFKNNRIQAKAMLDVEIKRYEKYGGRLIKTEKKGYIRHVEEYTDKVTQEKKTKTVYSKVKYYEFKQERKVVLSLGYTLKRLDRDEIAVSDVFNHEEVDRINYATFDGDNDNLVPGYWRYMDKDSPEDKVYDDSNSINKLSSLLKGTKEARSLFSMENALVDRCVNEIVKKIDGYKPEN